MNFTIEKLATDQIAQFHQVFCQVLREGFCYSPETTEYFIKTAYSAPNFQYWLSYGHKGIIVARNDAKEIIGYLVYDSPYGGVLFCRWLGVLKEFRKNGIASKLFDEFINTAKSLKCHKVEVAAQVPARGFYQKYGLTEEGFRKNSYFGIDQYLFGRVIGA
jgi:ribosomal protein S18 acetylase RimI-like enzyme